MVPLKYKGNWDTGPKMVELMTSHVGREVCSWGETIKVRGIKKGYGKVFFEVYEK